MRSVVDHVVDGIITIDARGTVESFNPAAEKLFGYRKAEVMGRNVKMLMPEPFHGQHDRYISNYLTTGRKRLEQELRQRLDELAEADRQKNEFLAMLAHELRNPLAPMRNALHLMKLPGVSSAIVTQAREMMERQMHQLVRLVDDLLDVSRIIRGKIDLRKEPVDLAVAVARAVETAHPTIEAHGHELK